MNQDVGELTAESALRAVVAACGKVRLRTEGLELIRLGSNAVYRLPGDVIARVGHSQSVLENARKQVNVAKWLSSVSYPAARILNIPQPVVVEGRVVTFWESASDTETFAPLTDTAELIRRLHTLVPPKIFRLPPVQILESRHDANVQFPGLSPQDDRFLREQVELARRKFASMDFALRPGVIHGDANVGNVILDRDDRPVLIDLDRFAIGPREWDLIQTAIFYDRFGWHTKEEYDTFVQVYGYDVMTWAGYSTLADIREVVMTAWLSRKATADETYAPEAAKRIKALRSGASRRDWSPY